MKDIYIDLRESGIKGDSRDEKHIEWVEVTSFNHVIQQPKSATSSSSGGHTSERVEFGDLVFTKDIDSSSPLLMAAACSGTLLKKVPIQFFRAYGGNTATGSQLRVMYYELNLRNAIVSSVTTTIGAEGLPVETFTLKASAMSWSYVQHKNDGTSVGKVERAWNLALNNNTLGA